MQTKNFFVPITKVDAVQRLVYGSLATEAVDKSGEIFDYKSSKPHVEEWSGGIAKATDGKSVGNLRAMHGKIAAGKFTELTCNDDDKRIDVCAKVVDDDEWKKVEEGVYTGFSIGGSYVRKWKDGDHTRYEAKPSEGSLVDLPCNPESQFVAIKADGTQELRKFNPPATTPDALTPEPPSPSPDSPVAVSTETTEYTGPKQAWIAKDGSNHAKKEMATAHDAELAKAAAAAADPAARLTGAIAALETGVAKAEAAKAVTPPAVEKREFSQEERDKAAKAGDAMPDGSFPIKNKGDLENAVKAFGRAKNKKAVKAHIKSRAKDLGEEGSLPDAWKEGADKALMLGDLRKGLYSVGRLAEIVESLEYLQQSTEWEATAEGDESTVPKKLKEDIANLCSTLREMVEEETNELLDEDKAIEFGELLEMALHVKGSAALAKALGKSAKPSTLVRELAKAHNADEKDHLEKAHGLMAKAGADCPGSSANVAEEKAIPADNLKKAGMRHGAADQAHLDSAHDHMSKMGQCAPNKAMSGGDKVHLDAAHDHLSKMGIGCGMAKSGARHSAEDAKTLTEAHDHLEKAGASCPSPSKEEDGDGASASDKAAPVGDLAKLLDAEREKTSALTKAAEAAVAKIDEFSARLQKLEEQEMPDPRQVAYRVVNKSEEDASLIAQQLVEKSKTDPNAIAKYLMQAAQKNPQLMIPSAR